MPDPLAWEAWCVRERRLRAMGCRVAGVDEVGRGALAGPVVAVAVVLPPSGRWAGLDDSKRLSPRRRALLYEALLAGGASVGVGAVGPRTVERENVYRATADAMRRALQNLGEAVDWVLTDAMPLELTVPCEAWVRGDSRSASVAAASVVAKVLRDRYMTWLDAALPGYGFARHKGYGTADHYQALARLGPSPAHRRTFLTRWDRAVGPCGGA